MLILFSYIFYFVAASFSPIQRRWLAVNRDVEGRHQVLFAFQVALVTIALSPLILFVSPFKLEGNGFILLGLSSIAGFSAAGYWICSYVSQKHVEAGISTLIGNVYTPVAIVLASL